jgi:dienelactone hydrolase
MEVMGVQLETIELRGADDLPLRVDLRHDAERPSRGKVVVCHGFKGFRRWGFFPWVGERLASAGWLSAVLDFSMNGIGENPVEFGRLDLFEQNTYIRELEDLDRVLADVNERAPGPMGLLGHSRASVDVVVLVTWNGVGKPLRFTDRQLGDWERDGRLEFTNARTGQKMGMSFDFVRDVRKNPGRFDLAVAATRMRAPHLIVHASADMAVPVEESIELAAGRTSGCRRVEIEGSTHTFGAVHPFEGSTPALERAMDLTLEWFSEHLQ